MPAIQLTDNLGLDINVGPSITLLFTKYLQNPGNIKTSLANTKDIGAAAIADHRFESGTADLSFKDPFVFASTGVHLTVNPKLLGTIAVAKSAFLFKSADDPFGDSIPIPPGQAYVSLCIRASLGIEATAKPDNLQFGFNNQSQIAMTNYRLFPLNSGIVPAVGELFQSFIIPGDLTDIAALPEGSIATVEGSGSLKITAEADLPVGLNPLATVSDTFSGRRTHCQGRRNGRHQSGIHSYGRISDSNSTAHGP